MKISDPPPPPECSRCPSESDKTGVMKIATKERDIDNDVIVYIGDAFQIFRQTLSIKQSQSVQPYISMISVISVYPYTLTVFHRKLTFYCEMNVTGVTIPG